VEVQFPEKDLSRSLQIVAHPAIMLKKNLTNLLCAGNSLNHSHQLETKKQVCYECGIFRTLPKITMNEGSYNFTVTVMT